MEGQKLPSACLNGTRPLILLALCLAGCAPTPRVSTRGSVDAAPLPPTVNAAAVFRILTINFETMQLADASGFFVSADGLGVTCAHVVEGAMPLRAILPDGRQYDVELIAVDPAADLALLQASGDGGAFRS